MMSKTKGEFRCDLCNSTHTKLYKGFGRWPIQEFQGIDPDMKAQYYKDVQGKTWQQVCARATDIVKVFERREETYACQGEFRPLGYWQVNGYDAARIEREAKEDDIRHSRLAGACYRVPVEMTGKTITFGKERTEEIKSTRIQSAKDINSASKGETLQGQPANKRARLESPAAASSLIALADAPATAFPRSLSAKEEERSSSESDGDEGNEIELSMESEKPRRSKSRSKSNSSKSNSSSSSSSSNDNNKKKRNRNSRKQKRARGEEEA